MDNLNDNWLDDILGQKQETEEIKPDEQAIAAAGLTHPDDLELERIVQETIAENWGSEFEQEVPADDPDATQFFTPQQVNPEDIKNTGVGVPLTEETPAAPATEEADNVAEDIDAFIRSILNENTPAQEAPATESPAQEAPVEESTAQEAPAEETPSQEAPAESKPQTGAPRRRRETPAAPKVPFFSDMIIEKDEPEDEPEDPEERPALPKKEGYGMFGIPHILATGIWAALILFIGITLGKTVWLCAEDLLALGKTGQTATITVEEGDTLEDVSLKLEEAGMIRYSSLFETFVKLTGKGENLHAGTTSFDGKIVYDYNALINALSYKDRPMDTVEVTIPEGYNCKQIFALLEEKGVCSVKDLENYAANGELEEYWFLDGLKRGSKYCLEGFLFPDTYEFYLNAEPKDAIEKMLDGFDYRFSDRLKEKFEKLNENLKLNLSFYEMVIMASMVQKEKATDPEGYTIASAFYNRLRKPAEYPLLNCDSTIVYAQDVYAGQTAIIDTFDTYKVTGLPPTPICNPGLSSLDAALEPESTNYYYFVLNKETNRHVFAKTYSEHQKNLRELGYYD